MVLPAPPAHDAPGEGAFLDAIRRQLSLTSKGLIVLVDRARPGALRGLVRGLLPTYPDLDVHTDVTDVYSVPDGSVMVLAPRPENADWLNVQRPVFARRGLKVILWCDEETTEALARTAVDFFDWISHRHECPDVPPLHGVLGIQTALCARAPWIVWTGGDFEACFRAALPGREVVHVSAQRPFLELVETIRAAGRAWVVWGDVNSFSASMIVEQAVIEAGRRSRIIIDSHDGYRPRGWLQLHGQCMPLRAGRESLANLKAPGRLAALAGLEPEAMQLIRMLLRAGSGERSVESTLLNADDPNAAIARRLGAETWLESSQQSLGETPPPVLRAFHKETWLTKAWGRGRWGRLHLENRALKAVLLASDASDLAELDEAEALARRAVDISERAWGPKSLWHASALRDLARALLKRGRFSDAESLLRRAIDVVSDEPTAGFLLVMLQDLADVLTQQGRYAEAEELAERAMSVSRSLPVESPSKHTATELLKRIRSLRTKS
jgi:tetratricopeptide (TPR) repeat protein